MSSARVPTGGDILRVFRLQKEDYARIVKLYPMDEDVSVILAFGGLLDALGLNIYGDYMRDRLSTRILRSSPKTTIKWKRHLW